MCIESTSYIVPSVVSEFSFFRGESVWVCYAARCRCVMGKNQVGPNDILMCFLGGSGRRAITCRPSHEVFIQTQVIVQLKHLLIMEM